MVNSVSVPLLASVIIGAAVGYFCVFMVVFVYRYKGKPNAGLMRVLGASAVAIAASFGNYLLTHVFDEGSSLVDAIAFSLMVILSMAFFFRLNRKKIG